MDPPGSGKLSHVTPDKNLFGNRLLSKYKDAVGCDATLRSHVTSNLVSLEFEVPSLEFEL